MEVNGTFALKLINRQKGETMAKTFRVTMKVIFLGACAAYLAEIAKQTPVLTGASRSALIWRIAQILTRAKNLSPMLTNNLRINNVMDLVNLGRTLAKSRPHSYPSIGEWSDSRKKWASTLAAEGQTGDSWMSDTYVPMILNLGVGNQVSGRYTFNFAIQNFYLEHYDAGTINDSPWSWGDDYPYTVGAWRLHIDGQRAFNEMFEKLIVTSGVLGIRAILPGIPLGTPEQALAQVEMTSPTLGEAFEDLEAVYEDFGNEEVPF